MKFLRILMAAVFCSVDDVFGDTYAAASKEFGLKRDDGNGKPIDVPTHNFSVYKGVLLYKDRVATLMKIPTALTPESFREKFVAKVEKLDEQQREALLVITQVRSMSVPLETNLKFSYGSPVFTNFIAINRSAFLANIKPNPKDPTTFSTLGHAQAELGLPIKDESGLQLMLSPREIVATRNIGKTVAKGDSSSLFDEDTADIFEAPAPYTAEAVDKLTTDDIKRLIGVYPETKAVKADGKLDGVSIRKNLVGKTIA